MNYDGLRQMIQALVVNSQPSSTNDAAPCTVEDMKKLVKNTALVLNAIVDELQWEFDDETVPDD